MNIENIKKAFAIISGAQARRDQEHAEFLELYHSLVVNSTPAMAVPSTMAGASGRSYSAVRAPASTQGIRQGRH